MFADDAVEESTEEVNERLEEWRKALERKVLRTNVSGKSNREM